MQKQQVFKVKGMQRDLSMANTNGEFAYEIVNMRLLPAEENAGLSLTNEKGTLQIPKLTYVGTVIGQCPTNDSLVFFTCDPEGSDYIYELYQEGETWKLDLLFQGELNFSIDNKIEAIFNYETLDIQKVYWIDIDNQLRCINIAESPTNWGMKRNSNDTNWEPNNVNNQYFDSVKEINSLPTVEIERVSGGSFTAGVLQYYITYFNEFSAESPIIYTSPLLYIAHSNRGANVNDQVSTAFKLTLTNLDTTNWGYIRIYATHRTSLDATPEGSIITEINMPEDGVIEFIDFGSNRTSITPTDLYYIGGKFVKAGTMTVKDQVMFLGNLDIASDEVIDVTKANSIFAYLRESNQISNIFKTDTAKQRANPTDVYQGKYYHHEYSLNNTESITHYKYGEKYRFGISLMDSFGNWSNPIWITDAFITVPPTQVNEETLELPCPTLLLSEQITIPTDVEGITQTCTLWEALQELGARNVKPLVVFPKEDERKVIAQGVVCPTVYNLKDRKENGPYAQASWFMRPNVPVDLWGTKLSEELPHKSDCFIFSSEKLAENSAGYHGITKASVDEDLNELTPYDYVHDDFAFAITDDEKIDTSGNAKVKIDNTALTIPIYDQEKIYEKGNWVEFRHNYALRSKGSSFGDVTPTASWDRGPLKSGKVSKGMVRIAELDNSRFDITPPVNRFTEAIISVNVTVQKDDIGSSNIYVVSALSPKQVNKQQAAGNRPTIQFLLKHTVGSNTYILPLAEVKLPKQGKYGDGIQVVQYDGSTWEYLNLIASILPNSTAYENKIKYMRLKAKRSQKAKQLVPGGKYYYIWSIRDVTGITLGDFINKSLTQESYILDYISESDENSLKFGGTDIKDLNVGNTAYYVDNSIVTVNSPEVELQDQNQNLGNTNFRIVGIIPLTATASDISLTVDNPSANLNNESTGLVKRSYSNTNLGYHGFKGMVASNGYYSYDNAKGYALTPLFPWQSVGTLGRYANIDTSPFSTTDLLKQKTMSNLRYSAFNFFFPSEYLSFNNTENEDNKAFLSAEAENPQFIGWKPAKGCDIQIFNADDADSIIKVSQGQSQLPSLVYRGNIKTIANLTTGTSYKPAPNPIYTFGYDGTTSVGVSKNVKINTPATGSFNDAEAENYSKSSQGTPIRYKSSPHYVVSFNLFDSLWGSTQYIQETLPAWKSLNEEGISSPWDNIQTDKYKRLYESDEIAALYHQEYIGIDTHRSIYDASSEFYFHTFRTKQMCDIPNYGWLWLGEIYREQDSTFGGTSDYALQNNQWENASYDISSIYSRDLVDTERDDLDYLYPIRSYHIYETREIMYDNCEIEIDFTDGSYLTLAAWDNVPSRSSYCIILDQNAIQKILDTITFHKLNIWTSLEAKVDIDDTGFSDCILQYLIRKTNESYDLFFIIPLYDGRGIHIGIEDIQYSGWPKRESPYHEPLYWTIGDTYYQRFDTLKTYAYSEEDPNSVVDITSFMVETRVNIDGRYDRNRGQESNLQMSPTNFNLMNDVYSQRDNFFTYRILDDDVQARTKFPNQITWSLSKTAGATVDAWMKITLASVLDLDGAEGELKALKTFNNSIVAIQESGISQILFNSRVQIPTSEMVPIQIANSGKVDGQQFISRDIGCQDKWNIVTTSMGLYFVDYFNKSIYRFNGQLEDLSSSRGFRGWCDKYINSNSSIIGYYDTKNREVMYYDNNFRTDGLSDTPVWLGYSELSNHFSSFYTYPEAILSNIKGDGIWLKEGSQNTPGTIHKHQQGAYNNLLGETNLYGLTVVTRQDSNMVKTFNNVEFRADTYNDATLLNTQTFDTLTIWTENDGNTPSTLSYSQYRPSNLKKMLRTWRANIPRVNNGYKRYVNQWAKVGLWKTNCTNEKTILHDLAVIYSE